MQIFTYLKTGESIKLQIICINEENFNFKNFDKEIIV